jgi:Tfp pilus assembly protein PilX
MHMYFIQDREAGNVIDSFYNRREAEAALERYESEDKNNRTYEIIKRQCTL